MAILRDELRRFRCATRRQLVVVRDRGDIGVPGFQVSDRLDCHVLECRIVDSQGIGVNRDRLVRAGIVPKVLLDEFIGDLGLRVVRKPEALVVCVAASNS